MYRARFSTNIIESDHESISVWVTPPTTWLGPVKKGQSIGRGECPLGCLQNGISSGLSSANEMAGFGFPAFVLWKLEGSMRGHIVGGKSV